MRRQWPGRAALSFCALCLLVSCDQPSETGLPLTLVQPCDAQQGCRAADDSLVVTVSFGTEPRALQPFPVRLQLESESQADAVTVAFSMRGMDMGLNRYRLIADASGVWAADITLPVCTSGRSDWLADFELVVADRRFQLQVPFMLEK